MIAAEVTFATPYAILVLQYYAKLIPSELDDAARIDGASAAQLYLRIYLPLMAPALAAVGTYALLFAWNDYFYQYMLLMSEKHTTVAMALEQFFDDDDAPWNYMMAIAILYSLPPIAIFYALRRFMASGLTAGGLKGMSGCAVSSTAGPETAIRTTSARRTATENTTDNRNNNLGFRSEHACHRSRRDHGHAGCALSVRRCR